MVALCAEVSARSDALRMFASQVGYAIRRAKKLFLGPDGTRFIEPLGDVLSDIDALTFDRSIAKAPWDARVSLGHLAALATRPSAAACAFSIDVIDPLQINDPWASATRAKNNNYEGISHIVDTIDTVKANIQFPEVSSQFSDHISNLGAKIHEGISPFLDNIDNVNKCFNALNIVSLCASSVFEQLAGDHRCQRKVDEVVDLDFASSEVDFDG
eukprot:CAMPEP_0203926496 /NCGR_PEP_ID=MMETSP0359-20131031/66020_1 /ASSEMBLY_ACC=CAM_ASM_000338 /TAXON_ID=268821 /ORGANISM="Scrippsiella Hangoei, Strain SHTV-5" /LENGTH=213 /DNA_ID=CAMNT_0050855107 /DNA_START=27 /DNA_END=668 /DNA_ORIENTATION=-